MIILNDLSFQTRSDKPNSDWTGEAKYVVEDGSELANKILNLVEFTPVVDEEGNLIDVEEVKPSITQVIENKCQQINQTCNTIILAGFDFNGHHYDFGDDDQKNISALVTTALSGSRVPYHASGEMCVIMTPEAFLALADYLYGMKTYHLTYTNLLKLQVRDMTTIEEVEAVKYGETQLTGVYAERLAEIVSL